MSDSTMDSVANKFIASARFFPSIEDWIDDADKRYTREKVRKVFVKAYILNATGGSMFFTCASCGFQNSLMTAAATLGTTPATVGLAFEYTPPGEKKHGLIFQIMHEKLSLVRIKAVENSWSEITRVRMSCRSGVGLIDPSEALAGFKNKEDLAARLDAYLADPVLQVVAINKMLDRELRASNFGYALVAERVRHNVLAMAPGEFGKSVEREMNKLIAAGHSREV